MLIIVINRCEAFLPAADWGSMRDYVEQKVIQVYSTGCYIRKKTKNF